MSRSLGHFKTLDGLRGLVAVFVLGWHVLAPSGLGGLVSHGYLGVDFFFVLSGFVVAVAYEDRLRIGLSLPRFCRVRLARLYPLLAAGMAFGAVVTVGKLVITHSLRAEAFDLSVAAVCAVFVLPFGGFGPVSMMFPFDGPAWSLFYELLINVAYAAAMLHLTTRRLAALVVLSALVLVVVVHHTRSFDVGGALADWPGGLSRVTFSFSAGVLLRRLVQAGLLDRLPRISPAWLVLALAVVFCAPHVPGNWLVELVCVVAVFPAIVALGAVREPRRRFVSLAGLSGRLSYPLYILHYPVIRVFLYGIERFALHGAALVAALCAQAAVALALSYVVLVAYDEPVRRALTRRRGGKSGDVGQDRVLVST